eukprot:TRINITY_DN375_c0_g1_i1.p1 TRINITY_DN375_c0_g1~~TRINITY_DN375_c0_g1_i1.p1  ORF type:complete len:751 (-),score=182.64 TRINITY_DN375_c0_g1_i1:115-2367(-)
MSSNGPPPQSPALSSSIFSASNLPSLFPSLTSSPSSQRQSQPLNSSSDKSPTISNLVGGVGDYLWGYARYMVSADKNRYKNGLFDLDLSYVTSRIIAMSFPAEGIESTFRNWRQDVAYFLKQQHPERFMIFNISEVGYDGADFNNNVQWLSFPDHHPPPLLLLFDICHRMYLWLDQNPNNVAVVHCMAGKGRTGTIIASFLVYVRLFMSAENALKFFAIKRSINAWGVTNPSQKRYVQYLDYILSNDVQLSIKPLHLSKIVVHNAPPFFAACCMNPHTYTSPPVPVINISTSSNKELLRQCFTTPYTYQISTEEHLVFNVGRDIVGDVLIEFKLQPASASIFGNWKSPQKVCRLSFHTSMIQIGVEQYPFVQFYTKADLDDASEDKRFSDEFFVELVFNECEVNHGKKRLDFTVTKPPIQDPTICYIAKNNTDKLTMINSDRFSVETTESGYINILKMREGMKENLRDENYLSLSNIENWKRRWCVLGSGELLILNKPRDTYVKAKVPLSQVRSVTMMETMGAFQITFGDPEKGLLSYLFSAVSLEKTMAWMDRITLSISAVPTPSPEEEISPRSLDQKKVLLTVKGCEYSGSEGLYFRIKFGELDVKSEVDWIPSILDSINKLELNEDGFAQNTVNASTWDKQYQLVATEENRWATISIWGRKSSSSPEQDDLFLGSTDIDLLAPQSAPKSPDSAWIPIKRKRSTSTSHQECKINVIVEQIDGDNRSAEDENARTDDSLGDSTAFYLVD